VNIDVDRLVLDDKNPRLPEHLHGASQAEILRWLFEESVLEELAISFLDHGYFAHEPLFAVKSGETWTVIEGNRRLAALMVLLQNEDAVEAGAVFPFADQVTPNQIARLQQLPVIEIESPEEIHDFLGFRHIGGIKEWPPEAKARWIESEIKRRTESGGDGNVFRSIARAVGTNAQSIRGPYLALRIVRHALDEFDDQSSVHFVRRERFGVLVRATNSPDLRAFIAPEHPGGTLSTLDELTEYVRSVDSHRLARVFQDMTPRPDRKTALLSDSRDVTTYAMALEHPVASRVLEDYGDLALAKQILDREDLPNRLRKIERTIRSILDEIQRDLEDLPDGSSEAVEGLRSATDSLVAQIEHRSSQ